MHIVAPDRLIPAITPAEVPATAGHRRPPPSGPGPRITLLFTRLNLPYPSRVDNARPSAYYELTMKDAANTNRRDERHSQKEVFMTRNRHQQPSADSSERRIFVRALALEILREGGMLTLGEATAEATRLYYAGWRAGR